MKRMLVCYSAGCLGALASSLVAWQSGELGFSHWAGVSLAPRLVAGWLYPQIVWGGLWGLIFLLPFLKSRWMLKGTVLSLLPAAFQLLYLYPHQLGHGWAGLRLGMWTPAFVLVYHWVWGVVASMTIRYSR